MPTTTVYKLVLGYPSGRLTSLWTVEGWTIEYPPGQVVEPQQLNSRILAFTNVESAIQFFRAYHLVNQGATLWECDGEDPVRIDRVSASMHPHWLRVFWSGNEHGTQRAFPGTVGCRSIRLVRRIDPSEFPKVA